LFLLFKPRFVADDYDHFTDHAESRVLPGSQTTRNVCLLARFGNEYKEAKKSQTSYAELPSNRSHAVLARGRDDCVHFYGGDEGTRCASTESSALKPGKKFQHRFAKGASCTPDDSACPPKRGKAKCWKRVFCYMEPAALSQPLATSAVADAGAACGGKAALSAWVFWLLVVLGVVVGVAFLCCAGLALLAPGRAPDGGGRRAPAHAGEHSPTARPPAAASATVKERPPPESMQPA
jgi:hypothetical protein